MAEGKFYWLKLKRDFFKRHDIKVVESLPNGKDYILFYLKLLLESIDHEGALRFSETIPYNEQMLSAVTDTNIDIVRSAMKLFIELNMMQVFDDKTIYMTEVERLIGSETSAAERVRRHRENQKLLQCNTDVTKSNASVTKCNIEIEKDKEKELEKELELDVVVKEQDFFTAATDNQIKSVGGELGRGVVYLTDEQFDTLLDMLGLEAFNYYIKKLADFIIDNDAKVKSHYETILKWYKQDSKV